MVENFLIDQDNRQQDQHHRVKGIAERTQSFIADQVDNEQANQPRPGESELFFVVIGVFTNLLDLFRFRRDGGGAFFGVG